MTYNRITEQEKDLDGNNPLSRLWYIRPIKNTEAEIILERERAVRRNIERIIASNIDYGEVGIMMAAVKVLTYLSDVGALDIAKRKRRIC